MFAVLEKWVEKFRIAETGIITSALVCEDSVKLLSFGESPRVGNFSLKNVGDNFNWKL
jgi:hypothetical protein